MPNTTRPDEELLSIGDAASLSGHSVATYRWYRANGIGPKSWKCGRYIREKRRFALGVRLFQRKGTTPWRTSPSVLRTACSCFEFHTRSAMTARSQESLGV